MKTISSILTRIKGAVTETPGLIPGYISEQPEFREIGERMIGEWDEGIKEL